ncbi:MAG: hydrogenase maturation nickel metallochaperone HypA [Suilimivivens sp.]
MHELGIIVHITKTLEDIAQENQLTQIGSVTLEVGEVSGIVPEFLTDCWEYYRKKFKLMEEARLQIETLPATTFCEDCGKTYPTVQYGKKCPYCQSDHTYLMAGNECSIKEIEAC